MSTAKQTPTSRKPRRHADPLAALQIGGVRHPRCWAHVPGVMYPKNAPVRPVPPPFTLPEGCPPLVSKLKELGPWLIKAGLWAGNPPHVVTMRRWKREGLIITTPGAGRRPLICLPATLLALHSKRAAL